MSAPKAGGLARPLRPRHPPRVQPLLGSSCRAGASGGGGGGGASRLAGLFCLLLAGACGGDDGGAPTVAEALGWPPAGLGDRGVGPTPPPGPGQAGRTRSNRAPAWSPPDGPFRVAVGETLALQLAASDPDGDGVWFVGEGLPGGARVSAEGALTWTPTTDQIGSHALTLGARDDGRPPSGRRGVIPVIVEPRPEGAPPLPEEGDDRPPCDPGATPTGCAEGSHCIPRPPGLPGVGPGFCVRGLPAGVDEAMLRMGRPLDAVLAGILPPAGSAPPSPPIVQVLPRSGPHAGPWSVRVCLADPEGPTDLDPATLRVTLQGRDVAGRLIWRRTARDRVCGQPGHPLDSLTQPGPWWLDADGDPVVVTASVADWAGAGAADRAEYSRSPADPVRFSDVTAEAGVDAPLARGNSHTRGVAWFDVDDDDWPDLYIAAGAGGANRLYRNRGDGTFDDWTARSGAGLSDMSTAAVLAADYDGDGDMDLFAAGDHPVFNFGVRDGGDAVPNPVPGDRNALLRNEGGGRFTDVTVAAGLEDRTADGRRFRTVAGAWGDLDRDGCPDLYLVHWRFGSVGDPLFSPDRLYRNRCDGTFEDATAAAAADDGARDGLAALFTDLDGDGWDDLYLANIYSSLRASFTEDADMRHGTPRNWDLLWRNVSGRLVDVSAAAGVGPHAGLPMGIDLADVDHDGDWDLFITDLNGPIGDGNVFYRSLQADTGAFAFAEESFALGDRPLSGDLGWGTVFGDFDNDGWEDLHYAGERTRWLWRNNGQGGFTALAGPHPDSAPDLTGLPAVDDLVVGVAAADYDRDGDLDLVWVHDPMGGEEAAPRLLRNDSPRPAGGARWLEVRLVGRRPATDALGATVVVRAGRGPGALVLRRRVVLGHSAQSQSDRVLHFGLGRHAGADRVEVRWPNGVAQVLEDAGVDRLIEVSQPGP